MPRFSLTLAVLWSIDVQKKSTQTETSARQTGTSTEGETERRQSCPLEAEVEGDSASSRLCPISSHLTWLVFISTYWQPLCLFLFCLFSLCNFYLGQRLLSCHGSPGFLYRLSWLPSQSMHGADTRQAVLGPEKRRKEVIHKVCGPSRGRGQAEASIYKLSLSTRVPSSINNILWATPKRLIP